MSKNMSIKNFLEIVDALDVPIDFFEMPMESFKEAVILFAYRKLSKEDKEKVLEYAKGLVDD